MSNHFLSLASFFARILPTEVKQRLYHIPWLAGPIRRGLNRAAPKGLTVVAIAAGGLSGAKMCLDMQAEKDYWLGTYEVELQAAIAELVKPGAVVYDVGANVGYITLLLARSVGETGKVIAFEPLPANLERLHQNLALNGYEPRVTVVAAAVVSAQSPGSTSRQVQFLIGPSDDMGKVAGSAGRSGIQYSEAIQVDCVALDDLLSQPGFPQPDLIKMDIEGGEILALPGAKQILKKARPILLLELHGEQAARVAWDTLTGLGYHMTRMTAGFPQIHALDELDWKAYLAAFPKGR